MSVKDYKNTKKLASYVQDYKEFKQKEKMFEPNEAVNFILESHEEEEKEIYEKIAEEIKEKKEEYSVAKKQVSEYLQQTNQMIKDTLLEMTKDQDESKDKVVFPKIGSISYEKQKKYQYDGDKEALVMDIIENGLYELLTIDEKALFEYSEKLKKETGNHVNGVREYENIKLTIR